jgi:D-alanyl-lipoteichoic acid acyltransferase DltB (MBOAT superfamily)
MLPQFRRLDVFAFDANRLAAGLSIFLIGLSKKVLIADQVAPFVDQVFSGAATSYAISFYTAWFGVVSFAVQVYFDFSGYADMAVGLGLMIGIALPLNFYSPYKARSLIELWRNWHITLSRFLRQYLYIPMGGRHRLRPVRYASMLATMTISGIWHGAGWPFVIWGFMQGVLLIVNHAFNHACRQVGLDRVFERHAWATRPFFHLLTFVAFLFGLVVFRADSYGAGVRLYEAMFGLNGFYLSPAVIDAIPGLGWFADRQPVVPFMPVQSVATLVEAAALVGGGLAIAFCLPNVYQMSMRARLVSIALFSAWTLQSVLFDWGASPFVYFQF